MVRALSICLKINHVGIQVDVFMAPTESQEDPSPGFFLFAKLSYPWRQYCVSQSSLLFAATLSSCSSGLPLASVYQLDVIA